MVRMEYTSVIGALLICVIAVLATCHCIDNAIPNTFYINFSCLLSKLAEIFLIQDRAEVRTVTVSVIGALLICVIAVLATCHCIDNAIPNTFYIPFSYLTEHYLHYHKILIQNSLDLIKRRKGY